MWEVILTVGLQLLGWFLNKSDADAKTKKAFFEFVRIAGSDFSSAKLMEYGDKQVKYLNENPWQES